MPGRRFHHRNRSDRNPAVVKARPGWRQCPSPQVPPYSQVIDMIKIAMTAGVSVLGLLVVALLVDGRGSIGHQSSEPGSDALVSTRFIGEAPIGDVRAEGQLVPRVRGVRKGARTFSLRATARGLFPGAKKPLRVKITNHSRFAIKVTRIHVRVKRDRTHMSCPPREYVRKSGRARSIKVGRKKSRRVKLAVKLLYSAPDGCQGAAFPLRVRATAVRA